MGILTDISLKIGNYQQNIVDEACSRVTQQCSDNGALDLGSVLNGFELNKKERRMMEIFSKCVYQGTILENQAEEKYWAKAKPYEKKADLTILLGSIGMGLLAYSVTRDRRIGVTTGFATFLIGGIIETRYRYLTSFFAGIKRRKIGDIFNPKEISKRTFRELEKLKDPDEWFLLPYEDIQEEHEYSCKSHTRVDN